MLHTFSYRGVRCIVELIFRVRNIRPGFFYLTRLNGYHVHYGLPAEVFFNAGDEIHQSDRFAVPDIINAVWCRGYRRIHLPLNSVLFHSW